MQRQRLRIRENTPLQAPQIGSVPRSGTRAARRAQSGSAVDGGTVTTSAPATTRRALRALDRLLTAAPNPVAPLQSARRESAAATIERVRLEGELAARERTATEDERMLLERELAGPSERIVAALVIPAARPTALSITGATSPVIEHADTAGADQHDFAAKRREREQREVAMLAERLQAFADRVAREAS